MEHTKSWKITKVKAAFVRVTMVIWEDVSQRMKILDRKISLRDLLYNLVNSVNKN